MENQIRSTITNFYQYVPQNGNINDTVPEGTDNAYDRKIFVSGLSSKTTEKDLQDYFSKFGAIQSVDIKVKGKKKNWKSFGFIVFNAVESVNEVLAAGHHVINNKKIDAQIAKIPKGRIFVDGITNEITDRDIKSYFSQFGNVLGVDIPFDIKKNRRQNFCYVIFETEEMAKKVLKNPKQIIKNKLVDIKQLVDKSNQGGSQDISSYERNSYGFGQNLGQPHDNQTYYGGYDFNQQIYRHGIMYNAYMMGFGTYASTYARYYNYYRNAYQNIANVSHSAVAAREAAMRGIFRGTTRGMHICPNRSANKGTPRTIGRGNRFQPF